MRPLVGFEVGTFRVDLFAVGVLTLVYLPPGVGGVVEAGVQSRGGAPRVRQSGVRHGDEPRDGGVPRRQPHYGYRQ